MLFYGNSPVAEDVLDEQILDFETLAAQAGMRMKVGETTATVPAIVPSTTYTYESVQEIHDALAPDGSGYAYSRNANPTVVTLEQAFGTLERAEEVVAFGSGMAAIHAALFGAGLEAGDCLVAAGDLYGVTRSLLVQLAGQGIETHFVDMLDVSGVEETVARMNPRVLYFESISNPLLRIADVAQLAEVGHRHRATVMVDNTFATPYLLRPLSLGADVVIHSATKYIAGHGDVMAGLVASNRSYGSRIRNMRTLTGGIMSPFDAWLTLRGLHTLPLRLERQSATAAGMALWLEEQSWTQRVYYPGLASHPQHALAHSQFAGKFPGMVSFEIDAGEEEVLLFIDALEVITSATSIGDVVSLVLYPKRTSHRGMSESELHLAGIHEGLVRLSVGLESPRDILNDLARAARLGGLEQDSREQFADDKRGHREAHVRQTAGVDR